MARKYRATPEEREAFERFLIEMDDVVDAFVAEARRAGVLLDFSVASLDDLERLLATKVDAATESEQMTLKNRAARYLGEVFRRQVGGKWELCLNDPKYLFFKQPV